MERNIGKLEHSSAFHLINHRKFKNWFIPDLKKRSNTYRYVIYTDNLKSVVLCYGVKRFILKCIMLEVVVCFRL